MPHHYSSVISIIINMSGAPNAPPDVTFELENIPHGVNWGGHHNAALCHEGEYMSVKITWVVGQYWQIRFLRVRRSLKIS